MYEKRKKEKISISALLQLSSIQPLAVSPNSR